MSDEGMARAHKASRTMEPIARDDYYVKIKTYKTEFYRRVTYHESIAPFQVLDIGALAAQTVSARTNAVNLDLQDENFGQWRWFPLDNVMARIFNPAGVALSQLKLIQTGIERNLIYRDPTLLSTEFCTWEDERPAFEGMNFSDYALNACRIVVFGFRYKVDPIDTNDYVIIEGRQMGNSVPAARVSGGRATPADALPLQSGEMPRVSKTLDALRMRLVPCTPIICAGNP